MKNILIFILLTSLTILFSCGRLEKKAKEITDKAVNKVITNPTSEDFSIRNIVKDFQGDSSIKEIKGIQINSFLYVEYCVYIGNRNRVLDGINKIVPSLAQVFLTCALNINL